MPLRSIFLRLAPAFAVALFLLLMPSRAHAQGVTVMVTSTSTPPSFFRYDATGAEQNKRDAAHNPEAINLSDCHADQRIRFPLTISGTGNGSTAGEVWATEGSADCQQAIYRSGTQTICYRLSANFIITPSQTVDVSVKEIIKGFGDNSSSTDAQGCRLVTQTNFTVWFLPISGNTDVTGGASTSITASTQGPAPLTGIQALPGDTRIQLSWDVVGEGGVTNVTGVQAYCDGPNPAAQPVTDASTTTCTDGSTSTVIDDSGDATTVTTDASCTTMQASAGGGTIPSTGTIGSPGVACTTKNLPISSASAFFPDSTLDKYKCGANTNSTGSSLTITGFDDGTPLQNGAVYAVAIAATDSFANVGQVSSPICQFPEMTTDFWRDYRNAGGQSGGGFCSVEGAGMPAGSFGLLAIGIVVGTSIIGRLRRRRLKTKSKSKRNSR